MLECSVTFRYLPMLSVKEETIIHVVPLRMLWGKVGTVHSVLATGEPALSWYEAQGERNA